ncbi:MAG: ThuA domain-containing protein [Bryobacteraceae bacterium]
MKIVLVAGTQSHGPGDHEYKAGCILLAKFLKQNGVSDAVVVNGGWPEDESVFEGASAIVLYMDGGDHHPILKGDRLATIGKLMRKGVGLACLHYAVEVPKEAAGSQFLEWLGGYYERPYSTNPFNDADLVKATPDHPISRGWQSFQLRDEWYYRMRFQEGDKRVTPILTSMLPKDAPNREVLAWATERADGGRGFGFTGLHVHKNWGVPEFRQLLINAILWTAKVDVPKGGAHCDLDPDDLSKNLFDIPKK